MGASAARTRSSLTWQACIKLSSLCSVTQVSKCSPLSSSSGALQPLRLLALIVMRKSTRMNLKTKEKARKSNSSTTSTSSTSRIAWTSAQWTACSIFTTWLPGIGSHSSSAKLTGTSSWEMLRSQIWYTPFRSKTKKKLGLHLAFTCFRSVLRTKGLTILHPKSYSKCLTTWTGKW